MARRATRSVVASLLATIVCAAAASPADGRADTPASAIDRIVITASADERQQIVDAINASPILSQRFDELASSGLVTAIEVVPQTTVAGRPFAAAAPVRGPFAAAVDGSRIVVGSSLLAMLRQARLFDVAQPDDVLPNQTVFVLAHLASHVARPVATAPTGMTLDAYVSGRLAAEARAYVDAWNATVAEAKQRNGVAALTTHQFATLLLNCRYRFAFLGVRARQLAAPTPSSSGLIEPSPENLAAITRTLEVSSIADVE